MNIHAEAHLLIGGSANTADLFAYWYHVVECRNPGDDGATEMIETERASTEVPADVLLLDDDDRHRRGR